MGLRIFIAHLRLHGVFFSGLLVLKSDPSHIIGEPKKGRQMVYTCGICEV